MKKHQNIWIFNIWFRYSVYPKIPEPKIYQTEAKSGYENTRLDNNF